MDAVKGKWAKLSSKQQSLFSYLFKLLLVWLSWKLIIFVLGEQKVPINDRLIPALSIKWEQFNSLLVGLLMNTSLVLLKKMGYWAFLHERTLWIDPMPGVIVGNYCLGLQLMYYFVMMVIITPLNRFRKLMGVIGGLAIVWGLNIARITGLVLISYHVPQHLYLAHDHLFNILVFAVLIPFFIAITKGENRQSLKSIQKNIYVNSNCGSGVYCLYIKLSIGCRWRPFFV